MAYKGKYSPSYPRKYKGDPTNIVYRSLWERKFMVYCDLNENILEWGSEEIVMPYRSPVDGRVHRYFPDFYIKVKEQKDIFVRHMNMPRIKQSGKQHQSGAKIEDISFRSSLKRNWVLSNGKEHQIWWTTW